MYKKELEIAKSAAIKAGKYLKEYTNIHVDDTKGKDIKLSSDKNSEKILIQELELTSIPILSEECGLVNRTESEYCWIIDPLDGTANYWKGMKEFACVSVALWKSGEPIVGVVYRFELDELYFGVVGEGAYCNGQVIYTSSVGDTKNAVIATGFPVHRNYSTESLAKFIRQVQKFKKVRMLGAAAIMGAFVGAGKIDVYMEDEIMLWDIAAATAIVKAAGGEIEIEILNDYKCICKCFANHKLKEDYYAEGI